MRLNAILPILLLLAGQSRAEDITITLDNLAQSAIAGGMLTFTGIIADNDAGTVDLNGASVNLAGMFTNDASPFLNGPLTVDPSGPTGDFEMFTVSVDDPYTDSFGPQFGTLTVTGGLEIDSVYDPNSANNLGSADFEIDVGAASPAAPEPGSALLLLAGAVALLFFLNRQPSARPERSAACAGAVRWLRRNQALSGSPRRPRA
jgi:hypothetical protein